MLLAMLALFFSAPWSDTKHPGITNHNHKLSYLTSGHHCFKMQKEVLIDWLLKRQLASLKRKNLQKSPSNYTDN